MEEKKKKRKVWFIVPAVIIIFVFCAFFFRIKKVTVEGNTFYSQTQMAEMFQSHFWERNILSFWLLDKLSLTPEPDFVREYEVSYPSLNELHIKLYEKTIIAGIAYTNQYIYFDKDGMVLQSTQKPREDIPLFETKSLTTFTLYEKVQMEDEELLRQIMNLSYLFRHYKVSWDRVQFNDKNEAFLYVDKIKISLGRKENYDEQISALPSILKPMLERKYEGEIDMTNYKVKGDVIMNTPNIVEKEK